MVAVRWVWAAVARLPAVVLALPGEELPLQWAEAWVPAVEEQVLLPAVELDVMAAVRVAELIRLQVEQPAVWMPVVQAVLREEVFLLPVGAVVRRLLRLLRRICRKNALPA